MKLTYRYRLKDGGSKVNRLKATSSHVNLVCSLELPLGEDVTKWQVHYDTKINELFGFQIVRLSG